jgi:hypothetical protein
MRKTKHMISSTSGEKDRETCGRNEGIDTKPSEFGASGRLSPDAAEIASKLVLADWGDKWGKPLTAGELLEMQGGACESLFHQPPIGPIPDYLRPYTFVHGCVAEYEQKLEEMREWKARELNRWLKDNAGKRFTAGRKVYLLRMEAGGEADVERYWFDLIEEPHSD